MHLMLCDDPIRDWIILKSVQTKSRIGRPICDTLLSRIGRPIRDWHWMILKSVHSQSPIGHPIRD